MSLHTKYRPKSFDTVLGQDDAVQSMVLGLTKKHSHVFLITGPSGTGKTTLARIAAKFVGCEHRSSITEIDGATHTGIDDMRIATANLMYQPLEDAAKALIIDEVHAISSQAFKALLKPFEEPPSWVYVFLCTTQENKLPKEIKNRCFPVKLKEVSVSKITKVLQHIVKKESMDTAEAIITLCAEEAGGSPRQAITNLEACAGAGSIKKARRLLESASENPQAIELARALMKREAWPVVHGILSGMKELNPESVRHVVRSYMTSVILSGGGKSEKFAGKNMEVLSAFSTPFPSSDGMSPLVMACGQILLGG